MNTKHWITAAIVAGMITACGQKKTTSSDLVYLNYQKTEIQEESSPKNKQVFTIDLSEVEYTEEPQPLSDFVESIEYIKLSEEPLIHDAALVDMAIDRDDNFYISGPNYLFKYTGSGTFIKSLIRIGQGPNEVAMYIGAIFNMERDFILIDSYGRDYPKISLDGEQIGIVKRPSYPQRQVYAYWKDYEMYKIQHPEHNGKINHDGEFFFNIMDIRTDSTIYRMRNHNSNIEGKLGSRAYNESYPIYRGPLNDSVYWIKPLFIDTIYCTTNWTDVQPLYIIKQHNDAADYEWLIKVDAGIENVSKSELFNKDRLEHVWALESGILYSYIEEIRPDGEKIGYGYCPANGKGKYYSKLFKNDIDDYCPSLNFRFIMQNCSMVCKNGYIYIPVNAHKFFEEGAKPPFPDLTEDSNPVIVRLKLKKN